MKLLFVAHAMLIDCGKASKMTKGGFNLPLTEAGPPPFNKFNQ